MGDQALGWIPQAKFGGRRGIQRMIQKHLKNPRLSFRGTRLSSVEVAGGLVPERSLADRLAAYSVWN